MDIIEDRLRDKLASERRETHKKRTAGSSIVIIPHKAGCVYENATFKVPEMQIRHVFGRHGNLSHAHSPVQNLAKWIEKYPRKKDYNYVFPNTPNPNSRFKLINDITSDIKSHKALEKLIVTSKIPLAVLAMEIFEISPKTLSAYRKSKKSLPTRLNEHIIKLNELYAKGTELFGEPKQFNLWMNTKSFGLGNHLPFKLINSITGINLIYEELIRIEFGATA